MSTETSLYQWLISQGVAVGVMLWFMMRMEKRIDALIEKVTALCQEVSNLKQK